jgi:hypothetical protein
MYTATPVKNMEEQRKPQLLDQISTALVPNLSHDTRSRVQIE